MKHSSNTFNGWTTVVLEIEDDVLNLKDILKELKYSTILDVSPNKIINKHDEDICCGARIVFVTNQGESVIKASIDDIAEIVSD
jgi:hypothetical protein